MKAMRIHACPASILISILAAGLLMPAVRAEDSNAAMVKVSSGTIVGVVTNSSNLPVARATVTVVKADGGSIRATVSNSDGVYSFADLPPGTWSLTVQVEGYPDVAVPSLQVVPSKATRHDVVMNVPVTAPAAPVVAAAPAAATAAPTAAQMAAIIPEALQTPAPAPEPDLQTPFAVGDIGWMNGNTRETTPIFDTKFFTPEVRFDVNYLQSFNHPIDHTIVGSTEEFRSGEFQIEQVSLGGNFHWDNVQARFLSMFGMFATTTPRNDASSEIGQWDLQGATDTSRKQMPGITST